MPLLLSSTGKIVEEICTVDEEVISLIWVVKSTVLLDSNATTVVLEYGTGEAGKAGEAGEAVVVSGVVITADVISGVDISRAVVSDFASCTVVSATVE